jgi:hypothetical protein
LVVPFQKKFVANKKDEIFGSWVKRERRDRVTIFNELLLQFWHFFQNDSSLKCRGIYF